MIGGKRHPNLKFGEKNRKSQNDKRYIETGQPQEKKYSPTTTAALNIWNREISVHQD